VKCCEENASVKPGNMGNGAQSYNLLALFHVLFYFASFCILFVWAVENALKINPSKSKAVRFTRARVKDPLNYLLMGTLISEASSCKYLGIILRSELSWADQVNYAVIKAWKAQHFTMRIRKRVIVIPKV